MLLKATLKFHIMKYEKKFLLAQRF